MNFSMEEFRSASLKAQNEVDPRKSSAIMGELYVSVCKFYDRQLDAAVERIKALEKENSMMLELRILRKEIEDLREALGK